MAESKIEWCDRSDWNPIRGCTRVSEGCRNCYAEAIAARFSDPGKPFHGFAERTPSGPRWTGKVELIEDRLTLPLKWRKPARIFVNSAFDLFHEAVPDAWIDRVFAVMALCPKHTFQVLTKRAKRMREYFADRITGDPWAQAADDVADMIRMKEHPVVLEPGDIPLTNVWLGVSTEDQRRADERVPDLLATPAAVRFGSAEPLLGPINFANIRFKDEDAEIRLDALTAEAWVENSASAAAYSNECDGVTKLDWIICGGESGPGARPMHPDWARSIRDQCAAAGVPFFFKQWGEWHPCEMIDGVGYPMPGHAPFDSWKAPVFDEDCEAGWNWRRIGKRRAGRLLDGVEHGEFYR